MSVKPLSDSRFEALKKSLGIGDDMQKVRCTFPCTHRLPSGFEAGLRDRGDAAIVPPQPPYPNQAAICHEESGRVGHDSWI